MKSSADARDALIARLRRDVERLEARRLPEDERAISTGSPALDRLLPAGGLRRGTVVEYLTGSAGSGAGTLALSAARDACREGRALVVLDAGPLSRNGNERERYRFYPPAAAAWGIDLSRILVLRPAHEADALWALDQALRCPDVGAVWAACDRLDVRDFRRLQLAAECGGTLGLLLRPARLRGQPTWADVRLEVQSAKCEVRMQQKILLRPSSFVLRPWQLRVELVRCRGGTGGKVMTLELDERAGIWREVLGHATDTLPVPAPVADSAGARRA
jgi:protein ImuA